MDADRRLNEHEADRALRNLFQASGRVGAPAGMDARILQRIAVTSAPARVPEPALLPKWVWSAMAIGLAGLIIFLLSRSTGTEPSVLGQFFQQVPSFSFGGLFTSPWLWMGCGSVLLLLVLEAVLEKKRVGTVAL
jgi:hypothetical protein